MNHEPFGGVSRRCLNLRWLKKREIFLHVVVPCFFACALCALIRTFAIRGTWGHGTRNLRVFKAFPVEMGQTLGYLIFHPNYLLDLPFAWNENGVVFCAQGNRKFAC